MPTTLIHYFTGTGNTAHAVNLIAEQLQAAGHQVTTIQVCKGITPPAGNYDYQLFAFPVLSWAPPVMMSRYIRQLPGSSGGKAAVLAINGAIVQNGKLVQGFTGQALEETERLLKRKKYDVFLTGNASFPENWTQMTNPCPEEAIQVIFPEGEAGVRDFIEKYVSGKRELYRCGWFNKSWSYLIAGLFGRFGRRVLGTCYIADERCTGCSLCARTCPSETIVMSHGLPRWKNQCEDCNRCINSCPEKAIQVSLPLLLIQTIFNVVLTIWGIVAVVEYTPQLLDIPAFLLIVLDILLILFVIYLTLWISLVPLNAFFRLLLKIPAVRRFCCISHTKPFRRYLAPGYKPSR
jgi:NAD-dependent dihydropyrimidine dehydrogenase PreA subunit